MPGWTWAAVLVVTVVLIAIVVMFRGAQDADLQKKLLEWVDKLVPFILGAGSGGAAGGALVVARADPSLIGGGATDLTWPLAVAVSGVVIAIATMVGSARTVEIRDKLVGYFSAVFPFVLGLFAGAGAGVGVVFLGLVG